MSDESTGTPKGATASTESNSVLVEGPGNLAPVGAEEPSGLATTAPVELADEMDAQKRRKRKKKVGRGVETMFRNAYRTHLELSSLADTKANIIISINGLIVSILLATVASAIDSRPLLLLPSIVLLLSCSAALVFAVLAARPRVSWEVIDPKDVRSGKRNLLFFGTFVNMSEDDFLEGIGELTEGAQNPYTAMARDLYSLGGVLARKYRLIRTAYTIFMFGLAGGGLLLAVILMSEALA